MVDRLEVKEKEVILLHYLHQLPIQQTADILGIALGTAKCSIDFNDKRGWKLFDITALCKNNSQALEYGVAIRFEQETASSSEWCGYEFASREAIGEWKGKRPRVLIVK